MTGTADQSIPGIRRSLPKKRDRFGAAGDCYLVKLIAVAIRNADIGNVVGGTVDFDNRRGDGLLVGLYRHIFCCLNSRGGVSLCGERCGGQKPENHQRGQQKGQ